MTTIVNYLGKCPHCLQASVTSSIASTSSFCIAGEEDVGEPLLVMCNKCLSLSWRTEIKMTTEDVSDTDDWWTEGSVNKYKKVLKDNQVNGKKLTKTQKQHLEQLVSSRERWRRQDVLDDRAKGCLRGMEYADIHGGTSSMALLVFQSLIENKNIGKDKIDYDDIGRRYLEWYNNNAIDTGVVNAMVFDLVNEGVSFNEASIQVDKKLHGMTASSRPACRALPITVYLAGAINKNPDKWQYSGSAKIFENFIERETRLTHKHLHASQISKAVNMICMRLMLDYSLDESIKAGGDYTTPKTRVNLGLTYKPIEITRKDLKNTGYADDALIAAIWFIRNTDSFEEAVKESIKLKGKSSYCSVLVGAIGGALYGYFDIENTVGKNSIFEYFHTEYLT